MNQQFQNQLNQNQSLFNRAKEMANGKSDKELEQIAKNLCATRGIDFDEALKQFNLMWRTH